MRITKYIKQVGVGLLACSLIALPTLEVGVSAASQTSEYDPAFSAAAKEFNVPESLLKAVAYNQSRWRSNHGEASIDGGYGIMNLTSSEAIAADTSHGHHGRGDTKGEDQDSQDETDARPSAPEQTHYTLDDAAKLLHLDASVFKKDQTQNIRGAAADLAQYAKDLNDGQLPSAVDDWYGAITAYSGSEDETVADAYADDIYDVIQSGAYASDDKGKTMSISPDKSAQPDKSTAKGDQFSRKSPVSSDNSSPNNAQGAECPKALTCSFIPAGYAQNDPNDPTLYGNYDPANRPKDMKIQYIIIHDTEGSYTSAIKHFQDTNSYVSAHYVVRSSDGKITQMVHDQDVSWGSGDWYVNMHGINIEHEGFAAAGSQWYTDAMYKSSATLVRWLANKYQIPLDRNHIIGHDNVPTTTQAGLAGQHWDPGPFWDWNKYLGLLNGDTYPSDLQPVQRPAAASIITMSPDFATNKQTLQDCSTSTTGACVTLPNQGTTDVYLRTAPVATAPLLSDIVKHPDGKPGTTEISDWSASVSAGEQYAVAATQGNWIAIWYGGKQGWFANPQSAPVAYKSRSASVTPKAGLTSIPVYGRPAPEASAYPAGVTPLSVTPLDYTIPAGQNYVATGNLTNDYYYDLTINYSAPHDHEIFVGNTKYYQIQYNHRLVYVKASDVQSRGELK